MKCYANYRIMKPMNCFFKDGKTVSHNTFMRACYDRQKTDEMFKLLPSSDSLEESL